MAKLEVCTALLQSVIAAEQGGASRIELCDNLVEGGTTPSAGMIMKSHELVSIPVHVLVRPRVGDFFYVAEEKEVMLADIEFCRKIGVAGVVIGALTPDARIDRDFVNAMIDTAGEMNITFHRAIDMVADIMPEMEWLASTRISRVLTSGQKNQATDAAPLIKKLIQQFGEDLIIMPGGGLNEENIVDFHDQVGAQEYHATLRTLTEPKMTFQRDNVYMGVAGFDEFRLKITDPAKVATFVNVITKSGRI